MSNQFYEIVLNYFAANKSICQLLTLAIYSCYTDDIPFPEDKLIGDWDEAVAGQKVKVTWTNPYRIEDGYLFTLPGLESTDILKGGFVHIPRSDDDQQKWYVLKHIAIFADSIELQPDF